MKTLLVLDELRSAWFLCAELIDDITGEATAISSFQVSPLYEDPLGRPFGWHVTFFAGAAEIATLYWEDVQRCCITYLE